MSVSTTERCSVCIGTYNVAEGVGCLFGQVRHWRRGRYRRRRHGEGIGVGSRWLTCEWHKELRSGGRRCWAPRWHVHLTGHDRIKFSEEVNTPPQYPVEQFFSKHIHLYTRLHSPYRTVSLFWGAGLHKKVASYRHMLRFSPRQFRLLRCASVSQANYPLEPATTTYYLNPGMTSTVCSSHSPGLSSAQYSSLVRNWILRSPSSAEGGGSLRISEAGVW